MFTHKLESDEDLYTAVSLQTMLTHSNIVAIDSCYLYCYAIRELIRTGNAKEAFAKTLDQTKPGNKLEINYLLHNWL